jgi:hypothetical protein
VEFVLTAETAPEAHPRPDVVQITSFPDKAAAPAVARAPPPDDLEEVHRAATDHVLRITARAVAA